MKTLPKAAALTFIFATCAWGQFDDSAARPRGISFEMEPKEIAAAPGGSAALTITFKQAEGVHINSEPWPNLVLEGAPWLQAAKANIQAEKKWSETLQSDYFVGKVAMRQTLAVAASAPAGKHRLKGMLTYYPCDDRTGVCYRVSDAVEFTLTVGGDGGGASGADEGAEGRGLAARVIAILEGRETVNPVLMFLLVFLVGIGTSFTPCVYPMIPITVGFFGARAGGSRANTFMRVGLYVLGIALVYAVLGMLAALGGAAFGSLTQKPIVLFPVAILLFAMALSMLGYFDLNFSFVQGSQTRPREGALGAFMMGAVGGLVASPCVTPVLVALLAAAARSASPVFGFSLLFVFALGMSALLGGLALFSSAARALPKSGAWMVAVKYVFGLLLLGVAVYFLGVAGETLGWPSWAGLSLGAGLALIFLGYSMDGLNLGPLPEAGPGRLQRAAGLALILAGAFFFWRGLGGVMPGAAVMAQLSGGGSVPAEESFWIKDDLDAALARAMAENKPLFVDFWAVWCVYCKKLETTTFREERVRALLENSFVPLKINYDKQPEIARRYGVTGLPAILFISPDGTKELGRVSSHVEAPELLAKIQEALRALPAEGSAAAPAALDWGSPLRLDFPSPA